MGLFSCVLHGSLCVAPNLGMKCWLLFGRGIYHPEFHFFFGGFSMGSWPLMMLCAPGVSLQFPSVFVVRPVRHPGTYSLIACRFIRSRIIFCAYLVCSTLFLSSDRPVHIFDHFQVNFNSQRTNILDSNDGDEDR